MLDTPLIAALSVGFVLALVFGALALRLRMSPIVGYLLAGVMVGPSTPGFVADAHLAHELSEIGVMLLMFGVGLHFSLADLLAVKHIAIPGALVQIVVATLLGAGLAHLLGWPFGTGLVFGLALSVASTVVLLRALEARDLVESQRGRIAVGWLIVEDLVMVLALVLLPPLAGPLGGTAGVTGDLWTNLLVTLAKVAAFIAVMIVGGTRGVPWVLERVAGFGSRELFTLAVLAIAMGIAYASAALFGVSFALGAFFAGMVLNESELSHKAAEDSLPLRDAFAVLFFVSVGMLFNPAVIVSHPLPVLATFLVIVVGKSLAALLIVVLFRHPLGTALTIAVSLAQIGEFSFILAGLGVTLGLLPDQAHDLVLAGAILSIVVNPLLFEAVDRLKPWLDARDVRNDPVLPPAAEDTIDLERHAVLVGHGRVGKLVRARLTAAGVPLVVVDDGRSRVRELEQLHVPAVLGNAASIDVLRRASIAKARWLVIAIPNAMEAGAIIDHGRALNPTLDVMARAHTDGEVHYLRGHGVDLVITGAREIADGMVERILPDVE
ncbi:MAG TPA: YbaL family putative K(+) efflux transporter [Candidatus Binatia bacterium]|nr:YbaL family putative K(+) efflux transporter [Candidatus Binatia bacterium]